MNGIGKLVGCRDENGHLPPLCMLSSPSFRNNSRSFWRFHLVEQSCVSLQKPYMKTLSEINHSFLLYIEKKVIEIKYMILISDGNSPAQPVLNIRLSLKAHGLASGVSHKYFLALEPSTHHSSGSSSSSIAAAAEASIAGGFSFASPGIVKGFCRLSSVANGPGIAAPRRLM